GVLRLVNEAKTGPPGSPPSVRRAVTRDSSGVVSVRLTGTYAVGGAQLLTSTSVDDPADYARRALVVALRERGVSVADTTPMRVDPTPAPSYGDSMRVAEHVSLPLAEEVKVTLKVSQNLHASMT